MIDLSLSKDDVAPRVAGAKRLTSVQEAISWPKGLDQEHKISTPIFSRDEYIVRLSKPGKEAAPDYSGSRYKNGGLGNNPNDMRPEITIDGKLLEENATFTDIFEELQKIHLKSIDGIRLVACLLGRSAYMVDHEEIEPGIWRYLPPKEAIERLMGLIPVAYGVPIDIFLYYLEALALNEDTKYFTLGYDITKDTGRRNNLLTCVHIIAVMLGEASIAKFAGSFASLPRGISAISFKKMLEVFPELGPGKGAGLD